MTTIREQMMAGVIVTLLMVASGQVLITTTEQTYYCEPENSVKECTRLSESQITCYDWSERGDRCMGDIWKPIEDFLEKPTKSEQVEIEANLQNWVCDVEDNKIHRYTKCFSEDIEGYLGELI